MIAVGVVMFIVAILFGKIIPADDYHWGWRDLFSTLPALVAVVLIVTGLIKWLWLVAP